MKTLCLINVLIFASVQTKGFSHGVKLNECISDDMVLVSLFRVSIGRCATLCRTEDGCRYVGYTFQTFQCTLHANVSDSHACRGGAILDTGSREADAFCTCPGGCCHGHVIAEEKQTQADEPAGPFCPRLDSHGLNQLGNQQLNGSRRMFSCKSMYTDEGHGPMWTQCLPNGTWSEHKHCESTLLNVTAEEIFLLSGYAVDAVANASKPLSANDLPAVPCQHVSEDEGCQDSVLPSRPHCRTTSGHLRLLAGDCAYPLTDAMLISTATGRYFRVYMLDDGPEPGSTAQNTAEGGRVQSTWHNQDV